VSCLHHFFEARADQNPTAPALVSGDAVLCYAEVESRANQLARHLRGLGVATGDRVALRLDRSPDAVIAILAALKAGAAYVPIDPSYPDERVRHVLAEAQIATLIADRGTPAMASRPVLRRIDIDDPGAPWSGQPTARLDEAEVGVSPGDLAYVIYTSGSTGRPKGVMAEHRNAVSFVASFNRVIALRAADRVFQGFALSFDGSVEEIWMAFSNGAALVVPPRGAARFGDELGRLITEGQVTVFSTVPTALSTVQRPLPTVRLLVVSGERCPDELVRRWATPHRRMLNVYGPTETTVNATAAECHPDRPVTIGTPLPGYRLRVLDEDGRPVAPGAAGELYVGGPGVARGYMGQPELTARHFVMLPAADGGGGGGERAYRTGDRVSQAPDGELIFHGRIDHQVKVRGFRIELPEIEAVLTSAPSIRAAVVTVVERTGDPELAAHVVPADARRGIDRIAVLDLLMARLPPYMVPAFLDVVAELPTLASGKVDRGRLPPPVAPLVRTDRALRAPRTRRQRDVVRVVGRVFQNDAISVDDHLFLVLGGHSLLAARLVSELRRELGADVAIRDVYDHPTPEALAALLDARAAAAVAAAAAAPAAGPAATETAPPVRAGAIRRGCAAAQAAALYVVHGVMALPYLGGLLPFVARRGSSLSQPARAALSLLMCAAAWPAMLALSVAVKWLVIGRYRAGVYPVGGLYYFRWWLVRRFQLMAMPGAMAGTPLLSVYFRLMGARVGRGCTLDTAQCAAFDLVDIGDDSSVGAETQLLGYRVEARRLHLGRVDIGRRCFVGIHAALGLDACMEDDARLGDLSLLPDGAAIAAGEARRGSPAQPGDVALPAVAGSPFAGARPRRRRALFAALHLLALYALGAALLPALAPAGAILGFARARGGVAGLAAALPVASLAGFIAFCLWLPILKAIILWRARPGVYRLDSVFYLRKWSVDLLVHVSRVLARPLYTTIYLPAWLRLMGARIGRRAEISTVSQISPDLVDIGEQSFFADGSMIGGRRIHRGLLELAPSRIGRRSFVGNSAILPVGTSLGDGCLIGCLSVPPAGRARVADGTEWLGSPSFALPHRHKVEGFSEAVTHEPTAGLIAQRLAVDGLRIAIPSTIATAQVVVFGELAAYAWQRLPAWAFLLGMPAVVAALAAAGMLAVVATKKALIGTFRPTIQPLWSMFVWLNEAVNGAYESVTATWLAPLLGTPFCAPWLRLMGCRIGRDVFLETTLFSEFDLVEIGDGAALNAGAIIQNHLFEDRVMKASQLKIGAGCTVGNMAVVLYDTEMQDGATVGPLSLLMKGEIVPRATAWLGIPTAAAHAAPALAAGDHAGAAAARAARRESDEVADRGAMEVALARALATPTPTPIAAKAMPPVRD
jgi:non-ribosomal peptide synthetase-like protein